MEDPTSDFWLKKSGEGFRVCVANQLPGDADGWGLRATLWESVQVCWGNEGLQNQSLCSKVTQLSAKTSTPSSNLHVLTEHLSYCFS